MAKKLYVGNLPFMVNDEDLNSIFTDIGPVASAKVITDRNSGRSKGFGFVEMANDEDADKAIHLFDGGELEGRVLKVSEAKPMVPRNPAAQHTEETSDSVVHSESNPEHTTEIASPDAQGTPADAEESLKASDTGNSDTAEAT